MIALINPPNPPGGVSNKDTMGGMGMLLPEGSRHAFPPLDLPNVAALLRSEGEPFTLIESLGLELDLEQVLELLKQERPKLLAIRTSTPTVDWDTRVAARLKRELGVPVLLFGPHVTILPETIIQRPEVDAIIVGEPEFTLLQLSRQEGFEDCPGVWFRRAGEVVRNAPRPMIADLDCLPFPAWDLMPYEAYDGQRLMNDLRPFIIAEVSRGCPMPCSYCPYPVAQGSKIRSRSPQNCVDGLEWLVDELGIASILFRDPKFADNRERTTELCEGIIERKVEFAWRCETRMEDLDDDLVGLMARAGCIGINLGVESADPAVLRNVKRRVLPLEKGKRVVDTCKRNQIHTFCFFVLGLPGETRLTALKTIQFALDLKPDFAQFAMATPYPGTALRAWAEERGFIEGDKLTAYDAAIRTEHLTLAEIQGLKALADKAWETRSSNLSRRIWRNPFKGPGLIRAKLDVRKKLASVR